MWRAAPDGMVAGMTGSMTPVGTLSLSKRHGTLILDGPGGAATLRTGWGMRRGTITTPAGSWSVELNDFCRSGVTARQGGIVAVLLSPAGVQLPDGGAPAHWSIRRNLRGYRATLSRGPDRISVVQSGLPGARPRIAVVGGWGELVVLTACFAVMSRRRGDNLRTLAVVGAIGHGQ